MHITIDLSPEQLAAVDALAVKSGKSREEIAQEAVEMSLIREEYGEEFLAELLEAVADADAGRFASDEEVDAVFRRFGART